MGDPSGSDNTTEPERNTPSTREGSKDSQPAESSSEVELHALLVGHVCQTYVEPMRTYEELRATTSK